MVGWLIPIVLGAFVAVALFLVVSIFSNKISLDTTPRRQSRSLANLAAVVCFAVAIYAVYPYVTLWRISNALQARDGELLASFIDWPTFRENLRSDFKARVTAKSFTSESDQNAFRLIGTAIGLALIDPLINSLVSPEMLRAWADTQQKTTLSPAAQSAGRALDKLSSRDNTLMSRVSYAFFTSPTEYRVDISDPNKQFTVTTFLSFSNLSWKVTRLVWPDDLDLTGLKTNTESAAQSAQPAQPAQPVIGESSITHLKNGNALALKGEYGAAIAKYDKSIELDPDNSQAYAARGNAYRLKGEQDRAFTDLNEAIRLDPKNANALNLRGAIFSIKGDHDKALADTNAAIFLSPSESSAYNTRGFVYNNKNDPDLAIADLNEAIRLDSKNALAYTNRGNSYEKKNQLQKALNDYESAVQINPKLQVAIDSASRVNQLLAMSYPRGLKYLADKQYDLAIQEFDRAISVRKLDAYYYGRGQAWLAKQDYKSAIADFTESIKNRERDYFAYVQRAEAYAGNGERENAITDYRRALALDPDETTKKNINAALKSLGNGQKDAERSGSTRGR
jgi:tetratricopeptide (TPR) repeat protein